VTDICESTRHDLCGIKLRKKVGWACSKLENQNKLSTHSMHPGAMKIGHWKRVNNLLERLHIFVRVGSNVRVRAVLLG